jgi:NAD(P)-dependent dehydrogenase (short-subunit alcohol dehydrogenase family)
MFLRVPGLGQAARVGGGDASRHARQVLTQLLGPRGIRVNSVAPRPIWTPLIPSTMSPEKVEKFGSNTPLGRVGQPAELAPVYVMLASDEASYVSGARVAVTGGRPML